MGFSLLIGLLPDEHFFYSFLFCFKCQAASLVKTYRFDLKQKKNKQTNRARLQKTNSKDRPQQA